jgi:hypothetical protein
MCGEGVPRAVVRGVAAVAAGLLVAGCGVPPDQQLTDDGGLELTLVLIDQYNSPVLATGPDEPTLYRVSADITIVFRFADRLQTLLVDLEGPASGRRTHHEFDLTVLAPAVSSATSGNEEIRVPLIIPELGALQYSVTLVNQDGTSSGVVEGTFTVQSALGASDTSQTQTTEVGTTTESFGP